jgi:hypothetical protein
MALDNSFNFAELGQIKQSLKIPEESVSEMIRIYSISTSILLKSLLLVIPFCLVMSIINAAILKNTEFEIDYARFWEAYANQDHVYILNVAHSMQASAFTNSLFLIFWIVMYNLVTSAIAGESKGTIVEKFTSVISVIIRKSIPVTIAVLLKIVFIMMGSIFLIPGIMFWLSMLFIEQIMIFEDKGFFAAWKRSNELMTGCKVNFTTFMTIASFALLPVLVSQFFYSFQDSFTIFLNSWTLNLDSLVALGIELAKGFIYSIYFCGTCLLYMKRTQVLNKLEIEAQNAE